jgi:FkbM family methyltransferase
MCDKQSVPIKRSSAEANRKSVLRKLLSTESEWNPKVMLGRVIVRVLPERAMHALKRAYYGYLIQHAPEDWIERDAFLAEKLIAPGDVVLDIGANLGWYSRFLARSVGPQGKVYAFEPIPQTYDFLLHNMRKLGLGHVEALNFALSDREAVETMVIPTYRWGAECWYDARVKTEHSNPRWREIEVRSRTLDNFFREQGRIPKIPFIKCDANYHELAVLKGALETIRASQPAMLIEVNPDPDDQTTTAFATFDLLVREGYAPYCFDGETLHPRKIRQRSQNYFFLTEKQIDQVEHLSGK